MINNNKLNKYLSIIYLKYIKNILNKQIKTVLFKVNSNDIFLKLTTKNINTAIYFLRKHSLFMYNQLVDIITYDQPTKNYRFTVNYNLASLLYTTNIIVSIKTNETKAIKSLENIYFCATWLEREILDLYGIFFFENSDLRRILTDYGFSGHPLRKDFPLTGFIEVYYSQENHIIIADQIELAQEFRIFTLEN